MTRAEILDQIVDRLRMDEDWRRPKPAHLARFAVVESNDRTGDHWIVFADDAADVGDRYTMSDYVPEYLVDLDSGETAKLTAEVVVTVNPATVPFAEVIR